MHPRTLLQRFLLAIGGVLILGIAIALVINAHLGVSPHEVISLGLSETFNVNLGIVITILLGFELLVALALGQKPNAATVIILVTMGPIVQATRTIIPDPEKLLIRFLMVLLSEVFGALGIAWLVIADLGASSYDMVMIGLARKGSPIVAVRLALDIFCVVIGFILGGPIGVGTVFGMIVAGPSIAFALKVCGRPDLAGKAKTEMPEIL
jgi:uncharacterized membrane protein YczE